MRLFPCVCKAIFLAISFYGKNVTRMCDSHAFVTFVIIIYIFFITPPLFLCMCVCGMPRTTPTNFLKHTHFCFPNFFKINLKEKLSFGNICKKNLKNRIGKCYFVLKDYACVWIPPPPKSSVKIIVIIIANILPDQT